MRLSVVIPARNEAETDRGDAARDHTDLERKEIDYEMIVVDDASSDGTAAVVESVAAPPTRMFAACARTSATASGSPCGPGLEAFEGDAVAIVMADGSDDPSDLVLYHRLLEEGYDCAFGSRFMPGADGHRLPAPQARDQPGRQLGHPGPVPASLQRHHQRLQGLPARGHRGVQPLLSNHFNLTVELPLKAIMRGHSYAVLPDLLARPLGRARRSSTCARWAAATCSSSSTSSSSTT